MIHIGSSPIKHFKDLWDIKDEMDELIFTFEPGIHHSHFMSIKGKDLQTDFRENQIVGKTILGYETKQSRTVFYLDDESKITVKYQVVPEIIEIHRNY